MQELLDFTLLRRKFELENPKKRVRIILFSKKDENVVLHTEKQEKELLDFLISQNPQGTVGEFFSKDTDLFVCIGKDNEKDQIVKRTNTAKAMKSLYTNLKRYDGSEIVFEDSEYTEDAIFSLILTSYSYDFLKKSKDKTQFKLNPGKYSKIAEIAHVQNIARFFGDTPANLMTPTLFVEYAKRLFEGDKVDFNAYSKDFIQEKGMNLILSVNQGSIQEPKLLQIRYNGRNSSDVDIALVGKGVCFDSGGISIKPSAGMYRMKHDMMGAATLVCAVKLAVLFQVNANITVTCPLVENMPSGSATKPGDVFKSMAGITVEVDNTDAEGRLILADALTFAQQDSPKHLFDAATLTGAMIISLGSVYAGYFTEDNELSKTILDSGIESNDMFWRMPLSPFYREALKSHVADINNMGGRDGSSCKAAEFLKEFVDTSKCKWAHFDIASTMCDSYIPEIHGKEATGRPLRGFVNLIEKLSNNN